MLSIFEDPTENRGESPRLQSWEEVKIGISDQLSHSAVHLSLMG